MSIIPQQWSNYYQCLWLWFTVKSMGSYLHCVIYHFISLNLQTKTLEYFHSVFILITTVRCELCRRAKHLICTSQHYKVILPSWDLSSTRFSSKCLPEKPAEPTSPAVADEPEGEYLNCFFRNYKPSFPVCNINICGPPVVQQSCLASTDY